MEIYTYIGYYRYTYLFVFRLKNYAKVIHPELEHDISFMESFLRWMNLIIGNHESCAHWDEVSTQTKYEQLEGSLHMSWHKLGYKTLFDLILVNMPPYLIRRMAWLGFSCNTCHALSLYGFVYRNRLLKPLLWMS